MKLTNKQKEILKERYPKIRLYDIRSFQMDYFTGEQMIEFAIYISKCSLQKANEEFNEALKNNNYDWSTDELITDESNIIIL